MVDIYNRARDYRRLRETLDDWPTPRENRQHILRYLQNAIDRRSPGRRYSDLWLLKRIFVGTSRGKHKRPPLITKPLSHLTIEDFAAIRTRCEDEAASKDTFDKLTGHLRNLYQDAFSEVRSKRAIVDVLFRTGRRKFFQWRCDTPVNNMIDPSKYYTLDEFLRMLRVAQRPKERALLAVAWEGTARPNEYLSVTVGDVEEQPEGFRIGTHISKRRGTAPRRYMYIFAFCAEFNAFWRCHPFRNDPGAPLFFREDNDKNYGRFLTGDGANKIVKKLDHRSGVGKNGTLYALRHGGYTWKRLEGMNPALAGKDMGWAPGGKEERRYLHLTEAEVMAERVRLATGREPTSSQSHIQAKTCPVCAAVSSPVDDRCSDCGQELDVKSALEKARQLENERQRAYLHRIRQFADTRGFRAAHATHPKSLR